MEVPENLYYTKDHEWIKVDGDTITVGITAFAQSELGEIVFVDLPAKGRTLKQKEVLCVVESTKAASDVYAPVSGEVVEVNGSLESEPTTINNDPYLGGWLIKLKVGATFKAELSSLLDAAAYQALIRK